MVDVRLVDYVKQGFKKGYTLEELQKILKENGWKSVEISEAMNTLKKNKKNLKSSNQKKRL